MIKTIYEIKLNMQSMFWYFVTLLSISTNIVSVVDILILLRVKRVNSILARCTESAVDKDLIGEILWKVFCKLQHLSYKAIVPLKFKIKTMKTFKIFF